MTNRGVGLTKTFFGMQLGLAKVTDTSIYSGESAGARPLHDPGD